MKNQLFKILFLILISISIFSCHKYSIDNYPQTAIKVDFKCDEINQIDSLEFKHHKNKFTLISKSNIVSKSNETLTIKTKDSLFVFKDNLSEESFFEYSYLGEFQEYNWTLILGQDYNQNYYYLINMESSKIYSLVGPPQIYNNKILAIEGSYTDGSALIEIWDIEKNQIIKGKSFSVKKCMIYGIQEAFLNEEYLYIRNSYSSIKNDFYKLKIKS